MYDISVKIAMGLNSMCLDALTNIDNYELRSNYFIWRSPWLMITETISDAVRKAL